MPTGNSVDQVFDVKDLAAYLQTATITIYRLLNKTPQGLPGVKLGGQWRVLRSQVDEFLLGVWVPPPIEPPERLETMVNGRRQTGGTHART